MTGVIVTVCEDRRYMFIRSPECPRDVFCHRDECCFDDAFDQKLKRRQVDFTLTQDDQGRPRAENARLVTEGKS